MPKSLVDSRMKRHNYSLSAAFYPPLIAIAAPTSVIDACNMTTATNYAQRCFKEDFLHFVLLCNGQKMTLVCRVQSIVAFLVIMKIICILTGHNSLIYYNLHIYNANYRTVHLSNLWRVDSFVIRLSFFTDSLERKRLFCESSVLWSSSRSPRRAARCVAAPLLLRVLFPLL